MDCSIQRGAFLTTMLIQAMGLVSQVGCAPTFYKLHSVDVLETQQTESVASNGGQSAAPVTDKAPPNVQPYLTLRTYVDDRYLFAKTKEYDGDLQILTVSLRVNGDNADFTSTILAYNLKEGVNEADFGSEVLKAMPVRVSSQNSMTMTISSNAVEKAQAEKYLEGLKVLEDSAGDLITMATGPIGLQVVDVASSILKQFETSDKPTASKLRDALNPSAGAQKLKPFVYLVVPTGGNETTGTSSSETKPSPGTEPPTDLSENQVTQTSSYLRRIEEISDQRFVFCSKASTPKLCTKSEGSSVEEEYRSYAYIVILPTLTYRISHEDFIWVRLPREGSCQFSKDDVSAYEQAIINLSPSMTYPQAGMEREILRAATNFLEVSSATDTEVILSTLRKEFVWSSPTDWLYTAPHSEGESYATVRETIRSCIRSQARISLTGLGDEYVHALRLKIDADNELAGSTAPFGSGGANPKEETSEQMHKRIVSNYLKALEVMRRVDDAKGSLKLTDSHLIDLLAIDIVSIERRLMELVFQQSVNHLFDNQSSVADEAAKKLTSLILDPTYARCHSCISTSKDALKKYNKNKSARLTKELALVSEATELLSQTSMLAGEIELRADMLDKAAELNHSELLNSLNELGARASEAAKTGNRPAFEGIRIEFAETSKEAEVGGHLFER